ncbi:MAG TPA: flagellar basal body-associated FliL family protein [Aquabacterium sp.]|nr:flagellar basal body-associated FliL family protein [Aquabacterium sp.]HRH29664.1 flagellar basal body-associated FliL family protein [Aquabacterium sp.]
MSAAPAPAAAESGAAPKGGKKKLFIIIGVAVAVLLAGAGGGAVYLMKKKAAEEAAAAEAEYSGDEEDVAADEPAKKPAHDAKKEGNATPPVFIPLDPFTVNLADRETDRYAQIGISLQVDDAKVGDELKVFMPAIRNSILLILSHKSADQLLSLEGKTKLAEEIKREAARAMGYEIQEPEVEAPADAAESAPKKKKKKKRVESYNPIVQVHYATFIIQ